MQAAHKAWTSTVCIHRYTTPQRRSHLPFQKHWHVHPKLRLRSLLSRHHQDIVPPFKALQDPLQEALYETWGAEADDWDTQEYTDDQLINALYDDNSSPESVAQNVLAVTLALLLFLAVGNIVWKIVAVSWALVSAAVRYSTVAFILVCIAVFLA